MPKRSFKSYATPAKAAGHPSWSKALLALSLVPLVAGVLLILAWAMDFEWLPNPQEQIVVGTMFLLLGFAMSNLVQRKWSLAAGWALLLLADYLVFTQTNPLVTTTGLVVGAAGLVLVGMDFFRNIRSRNLKQQSKNSH